ncbi:MAG: hypothetical protein SGI92_14725 [Bryobacteraceae bacterium]|nr:hypothetical protein [Bryobacteraceae bacterium]
MRLLAVLVMCGMALLGQKVKPDVDYYDSISDYFRQSSRAVQAIAQKGIPAEEIPAVLTIARRSNMSPNQVIAARKSGKSFESIAKDAKVAIGGTDFISQANLTFLSEYHGQPKPEVQKLRDGGASFIEINKQYRRSGTKPR